jgi:hypothetical protein
VITLDQAPAMAGLALTKEQVAVGDAAGSHDASC